MKYNKKGQLTIFIIIGIVLLFSTALIVFIRQNVTQYKPPVEIAFEQVPTELQPLQKFVTDCLEQVTKEGLRKAGMQGGYIDASSLVVNEADPTSGDGISMSPGNDIKIPFWYYMKSSNTCSSKCEFASKQPSLYRGSGLGNSLEEQLDKYVEERLSSCVADMSTFNQQGFKIEQKGIKALTTIAKTDVFVQLEYPLTITKEGRVQTISKFTAKIPLNLGKMYDMAVDITRKQAERSFLDFLAVNLIDIHSGVDENKLPPLAETTFFRSANEIWKKTEVKSKIEELLMTYTPALQALGTSNFQGNLYTGDSPLGKGLYDFFILELNKTYKANAEFTYLAWWPIYLDVTPNAGELIRPDSVSGLNALLSTFAINQYKFAYDVSYPLLVTLTDTSALGGEGFTFQFALESNMRNNAAMKADSNVLSYSGRSAPTLVCNPGNFKSGNITIDVSDSIDESPVEGATVYFSFGKEACFIGETNIVSKDGKALMISRMPVGIGNLIVSRENYSNKIIPFGTSLNEKQEIPVKLDRFVELELGVARIPVVKSGVENVKVDASDTKKPGITFDTKWSSLPEIPDLESTQSAIISLVKIPETSIEPQYAAAVELRGDGNRTEKVRLSPGRYQISASLFDNQVTIVPEAIECFQDDWYDQFGLGKERCEKIDAVIFDTFPKGGVSITSFNIDAAQLKTAKKIIIKMFATPDGYTRDSSGVTNLLHKDLDQMSKAEKYSSDYPDAVRPVFK